MRSSKAIRIDTNETTEVKANHDGIFTIPFLNPVNITSTVSAPGFATLKREDITLRTADKLNLPLKLQVGQMTQEVT